MFQEKATIPFIARYRRNLTGGADSVELTKWHAAYELYERIQQKKGKIFCELSKRKEDKRVTPSLLKKVKEAFSLSDLEDLWLPFKEARCTRADVARKAGLETLIDSIYSQTATDTTTDQEFRRIGKLGGYSSDTVNKMAIDLLAERFSESVAVRGRLREFVATQGLFVSSLKKNSDPRKVKLSSPTLKSKKRKRSHEDVQANQNLGTYHHYHNWTCSFRSIRHHQLLAIERGVKDGALSVTVKFLRGDNGRISTVSKEKQLRFLVGLIRKNAGVEFCKDKKCRRREFLLDQGAQEAWTRLIRPSLVREIRQKMRNAAHKDAIECFAENLHSLLMQAPRRGYNVLGIDPGFRNGCKLATVDSQGSVIETANIWPFSKQISGADAKKTVTAMCDRGNIEIIAIGNGTASKEVELWLSRISKLPSIIVDEAGVSVYSTSAAARDEFGSMDPLSIGAISIARKLQDPLSEMVKVPPASLGVGMYQHDLSEKDLENRLGLVVSDVVSNVGVDVNTASVSLLRHVSGLNRKTAAAIHKYVREVRPLKNRQELLRVQGVGPKAFEYAAGFLKISNGNCFLDQTNVHPEAYKVVATVLRSLCIDEKDLVLADGESSCSVACGARALLSKTLESSKKIDHLCKVTSSDPETLSQILSSLLKRNHDPREDGKRSSLNDRPSNAKELKVGATITGVVRNRTPFGSFIDIGVGIDALLHNSQMSAEHKSTVKVGLVVNVDIMSVDLVRKRIGVSSSKRKKIRSD